MRSVRLLCLALAVAVLLPLGMAWLMRAPHRRVALGQDIDLEAGSLLVADRKLRDPNFAQTVILLVKYEEEGSMGLMLNRRTDVAVSQVLSDWREAKGRDDLVFLGGPVEKGAVMGLIDSRERVERAHEVLTGVQMAMDGEVLRKQLAAGAKRPVRFFLGYAGWGPEQLEAEIEAGAWHVLRGDRRWIFDADPDTLWTRMIEKTEMRIARAASSR